ncbi:class I SAM-dependent methyltransferase [Alkalicoccobacillus plakortidis]|uniref:Methyltransferase domain-containing protein n=1 Tax=Alkalicoccobacillus plakortidis TaxID=444060 RepID=A0ABT0XN26_9BACI|nr:class I SAM-dependent methyltransferase [Alkalicoccobacillus plakortidis]MCM2677300.1 methyltransferase domain-containing protein [Alkalicoccobacillus plakortidis]
MTQKQDTWNATLYDASHSFVSSFGTALIDLLNPQKGEHILDLGCGTGDLAALLDQSGVSAVGVDKSEAMVEQARSKYPTLAFDVKDATNLGFYNEFDAVFSNATLHWVKPPEQALSNIYASLKSGGRFVAEFGGKGNVKQMTDELMKQLDQQGAPNSQERFPWYYPSIGEYTTLMEQAGFRVIFAQHFDRPTPLEGQDGLRNWISMFGSSFLEGLSISEQDIVISNTESALKERLYKEGQWVADYKRIRTIGIKE